jgi:hypothetical protein
LTPGESVYRLVLEKNFCFLQCDSLYHTHNLVAQLLEIASRDTYTTTSGTTTNKMHCPSFNITQGMIFLAHAPPRLKTTTKHIQDSKQKASNLHSSMLDIPNVQ